MPPIVIALPNVLENLEFTVSPRLLYTWTLQLAPESPFTIDPEGCHWDGLSIWLTLVYQPLQSKDAVVDAPEASRNGIINGSEAPVAFFRQADKND